MRARRRAGSRLAAWLRSALLPALALPSLLHGCAPGQERDRQTVHPVRMVARGDHYAFEPAEVRVRPGDAVRFVLAGSQPESVVFDTAQAPPGGAAFLRDQGLTRGVLLTRPGQAYEVSFRGAPPGRYVFHSVPHAVFGMRGVVEVVSMP